MFITFIVFSLPLFVNGASIEALHDLMTDDELAYYFRSEDRTSIPAYDVVYLPIVLHVKEALDEEGSEEIEYNFEAFQR